MHWLAAKIKYTTPMDAIWANRVTSGLNGRVWDVEMLCYVCYCHGCNREFYSERPHAKTCSDACRKRKSRKQQKQSPV